MAQTTQQTTYHLLHRVIDDRWHLEEDGAGSADSFLTKAEGALAARERAEVHRARGTQVRLIVHREDGAVETDHWYV